MHGNDAHGMIFVRANQTSSGIAVADAEPSSSISGGVALGPQSFALRRDMKLYLDVLERGVRDFVVPPLTQAEVGRTVSGAIPKEAQRIQGASLANAS